MADEKNTDDVADEMTRTAESGDAEVGNAAEATGGDESDLEDEMLKAMQGRNLINGRIREPKKLCSGQTLFCKSLGLKVPDWNQKRLIPATLELVDPQDPPLEIIQTTRLGIPKGRDEHLPLRYLDAGHAESCTQNPLKSRKGINHSLHP